MEIYIPGLQAGLNWQRKADRVERGGHNLEALNGSKGSHIDGITHNNL